MKFKIERASYDEGANLRPCIAAIKENDKWFVQINSLEELIALIDETKNRLIIDKDEIIVYNDYVE